MSKQRYTPEFKDEAVRQDLERGYSVAEVSERLGVSTHSLSVSSLRKKRKIGKNVNAYSVFFGANLLFFKGLNFSICDKFAPLCWDDGALWILEYLSRTGVRWTQLSCARPF